MFLKALYVENWKYTEKPLKLTTRAAFAAEEGLEPTHLASTGAVAAFSFFFFLLIIFLLVVAVIGIIS
jgi:hypothetical protein